MGYWVFFLILSIPGVINNLGNILMSLSPSFPPLPRDSTYRFLGS